MAIDFVRTLDGSDDSIRFQPMERLKVYLFGATVLFASFGTGEAVYRLLFSEFDGATDRITNHGGWVSGRGRRFAKHFGIHSTPAIDVEPLCSCSGNAGCTNGRVQSAARH